jgi:hypothetical protein
MPPKKLHIKALPSILLLFSSLVNTSQSKYYIPIFTEYLCTS